MPAIHLYLLIERRAGNPNVGRPFYVGIGNKKRPLRHLFDAKTVAGHYNHRMQEILLGHIALGIEPEVRLIAEYQDRESAFVAERREIASYGRVGIDRDGTLANLAAGGQGADSAMMLLPEMRAKVSERTKRAIHDPTIRAAHVAALARINSAFSPEQRRAAAAKKTPEATAASTAALAAARNDPEAEQRRRASERVAQKASWADPEIRARRIAAMTGKKKTMSAEALAARRENITKAHGAGAADARREGASRKWADPEFRAKRSANQAAAWADPEKRANMLAGRSEGVAASWRDPAVRARRIAGQRKTANECGDGHRD